MLPHCFPVHTAASLLPCLVLDEGRWALVVQLVGELNRFVLSFFFSFCVISGLRVHVAVCS